MVAKSKSNLVAKISFGKKKKGVHKKKFTKNEQAPKKYRGQGR